MTAARTTRPTAALRAGSAWVGAVAVAVLVLAGCSNTTSSINRNPYVGSTTAAAPTDGQAQLVVLDVGNDYRFTPSTVTVHPGRVTFMLENKGTGAPHDVEIMGIPTDHSPLVQAGQTTEITFTAPSPGTYTFDCSIHIAQGMTGKLVVLSQ